MGKEVAMPAIRNSVETARLQTAIWLNYHVNHALITRTILLDYSVFR
jgi:hypothetical protein